MAKRHESSKQREAALKNLAKGRKKAGRKKSTRKSHERE